MEQKAGEPAFMINNFFVDRMGMQALTALEFMGVNTVYSDMVSPGKGDSVALYAQMHFMEAMVMDDEELEKKVKDMDEALTAKVNSGEWKLPPITDEGVKFVNSRKEVYEKADKLAAESVKLITSINSKTE